MMAGTVLLLGLLAFFIIALCLIWRFLPDNSVDKNRILINQVNELLPQTQCGHCGYKGCLPYAEAIVNGEAINRCAPGGDKTIATIAELLHRPFEPLDTYFRSPAVAFIREEECIGCTKCIQACPVDAIIGAPRLMHTVVADDCTGCDLCVDACPVDCIDMVLAQGALKEAEEKAKAHKAKADFEIHNARIAQQQAARQQRLEQRQIKTDLHKMEQNVDPVAAALAKANVTIATSALPAIQQTDNISVLTQRINTLEEKLKTAQSPAKEVIEKTLTTMREQLAREQHHV